MIGIGIDIGSTAAKAAVVDGEGSVAWTCVQPTGFSSVDASERLREALAAAGYDGQPTMCVWSRPATVVSPCPMRTRS